MASFDSIIKLINDNMDTVLSGFDREIEIVLKTISDLVAIRAIETISDPLKFDFEFQKILRDSGYNDLVSSFINQGYDKNYTAISELFSASGLSATFSETDLTSINALKSLDLEFFNDIGKTAAQELKRDLYKYSVSGMTSKELTENIKASLDGTALARHSKTYAETSISNFNQSLIDLKTEGIEGEVYTYEGVRDKKTRDFCRCLLNQNKYYDKSDANKIKNDKRRQFNCRHLVVAHSLEFAIEDGYKSGSFSC